MLVPHFGGMDGKRVGGHSEWGWDQACRLGPGCWVLGPTSIAREGEDHLANWVPLTTSSVRALEGFPGFNGHRFDGDLIQGGEPSAMEEIRDADPIPAALSNHSPGNIVNGHLGGFEGIGGWFVDTDQAWGNHNCSRVPDLTHNQPFSQANPRTLKEFLFRHRYFVFFWPEDTKDN
eukprot:maker-scaffold395_size185061-snap-gene-0.38 protein:Tk08345 transcript:maker-scaffold395_size185061-snap-gene-0.38-mRNA-1 annotation:"dead deah box helicase domain protein"